MGAEMLPVGNSSCTHFFSRRKVKGNSDHEKAGVYGVALGRQILVGYRAVRGFVAGRAGLGGRGVAGVAPPSGIGGIPVVSAAFGNAFAKARIAVRPSTVVSVKTRTTFAASGLSGVTPDASTA
jgi:hypothetical protein